MLILTRSDMRAALAMPEAIETAAAALAEYSAGNTDVPLRINLTTPDGANLYMPGLLRSSGALGAKLVSVYPGNVGRSLPTVLAVLILQDAGSGEPLAAMEASHLTAIRTGAAGGVAVRYLARPDARTLLLIGGGAQGRTQVQASRVVRGIAEIVVVDTNPAVAETALAEIAADQTPGMPPATVRTATDPNPWVGWADIVICATTSSLPVFDGRLARPGTHVTGIGSYTAQMQELPPELVVAADRLVCDAREAAWHESGDLSLPRQAGLIGADRVDAELGDLVLGRAPGRVRAGEITVYKGVGLAALDLATAQAAFLRAKQLGLGTEIDLLA